MTHTKRNTKRSYWDCCFWFSFFASAHIRCSPTSTEFSRKKRKKKKKGSTRRVHTSTEFSRTRLWEKSSIEYTRQGDHQTPSATIRKPQLPETASIVIVKYRFRNRMLFLCKYNYQLNLSSCSIFVVCVEMVPHLQCPLNHAEPLLHYWR